ncbi:calmodulin-like [Lineus longissimus]|uniref:calmodulin-like n=1 Tax=Lineus longissimus TaxID=88925 RepID=UPI002B4F558A
MARHFKETDIDEFKECFFLYARRGTIVRDDELSLIMRSLGFNPTSSEVTKYFKKHQRDGKIEFAIFLDVLYEHSKVEKCQDEMLAAFRATDRENRGYISAKDLRHILMSFGEKLSKREVDSMLKEANVSGSGQIRYNEFVKSMLMPVPDY